MGREVKTYELHPLCTLFPRVEGEALDALIADIKANGLREPITLHDGMILDGGNRYAACAAAGIEPKFVQFDGASIGAFVLSANLHRRHLSPGQQAAIVASVQDWAKAEGRGGDRKSDQTATLPLDTVADRAAQSGASERTQRMADKVVRADPKLAKQVIAGETTLPKAVEKITGKSRKKVRKVEPDTAAASEYDPRDDQIKEAQHTIVELSEENDRLKDRIAVEAWDASEEEKLDAQQIIDKLREENRNLQVELNAVKRSRDQFQNENAQMKRQLKAQRNEIARLNKRTEAA